MHDQPLLRMSLPSIPSFVLSGLLLLCLPFSSFASATTSHISFSYAARQRMQNRARLLKQYQTHLKMDIDGELNDVELVLSTTTFKKEAFIERNIGLVKDQIIGS